MRPNDAETQISEASSARFTWLPAFRAARASKLTASRQCKAATPLVGFSLAQFIIRRAFARPVGYSALRTKAELRWPPCL